MYMRFMNINLFGFIILILKTIFIHSFIPHDLIELIFEDLGSQVIPLDEASDTITHDDIIEYGLAQSVADYFRDKPNGTNLILTSKYNNTYKDVREVYYDYYGLWLCDLDVSSLIKDVFRPNVAYIDLNPDTKDNPYYHFDAERLRESNKNVMNKTNAIYSSISAKDYVTARKNTGRVLHTIQDFYSHSNWIENGNTDINTKIGSADFDTLDFVSTTEANPCQSNCATIQLKCNIFLQILAHIIKSLFNKTIANCPITYYRCNTTNIITNKLVSGYYSGQKLDSGDAVPKPSNLNKCSHGGILDTTATTAAEGGINKDSGYYVLSPRAFLHLEAVRLATQHTRLYFNKIRSNFGDSVFEEFLSLKLPDYIKNANNSQLYATRTTCASMKTHNISIINTLIAILLFIFIYKN